MRVTDVIFKEDKKADPKIVAKFADISDSQRSYYIYQWAKEKGIDSDDAMQLAGYKRGSYMGAGSYMWDYDPPNESIEEAPVGMMKKAGQAVGAKVLSKIGMKGKAGNLAGKADLSDTANNLYNEFRKFLGTQGKDVKTATGEELAGFLKSKGANVPNIPTGVVTKQQINAAIMQAAKDAMAGKAGVQKPAPASSGAPQAAGGPAPVDANKDGKDDKTGKPMPQQAKQAQPKISPDLMKKIKALNPQQKKELASIL